ncbi:MAG: hypothetical protein IPK64_21920 [bacterium]|nr:hypothetical protein [bacterium]
MSVKPRDLGPEDQRGLETAVGSAPPRPGRAPTANGTPRGLSPESKRAFETARPPRKETASDREIVREMLPAIRRKRDEGWSYEAIRQELAKRLGFKGTRQTLYNYVWCFTKKRPPSPADAAPKRRTVRETLCGSSPDLPAAGGPRPRATLVEKLNRPV